MEDTNIYNELAEIEMLKDRIRANQDQVLDIYDTDHEAIDMMRKLLTEMSDLLVEVDQVENEMQELMKKL